MSQTFRVGLTRDILAPDGTIGFGDIGFESARRRRRGGVGDLGGKHITVASGSGARL